MAGQYYPGDDRQFDLVLDDGAPFRVRPLTPADREELSKGISKLSPQSRYFRFFSAFPEAPPSVLDNLSSVDGYNHVAWCGLDAALDPATAVAAAHAIKLPELQNTSEVALAVLDDYHHRGIARLLLTAVFLDLAQTDITHLRAEVLSENRASARLFTALGGRSAGASGEVVHFEFTVESALNALSDMARPAALSEVFAGLS